MFSVNYEYLEYVLEEPIVVTITEDDITYTVNL